MPGRFIITNTTVLAGVERVEIKLKSCTGSPTTSTLVNLTLGYL